MVRDQDLKDGEGQTLANTGYDTIGVSSMLGLIRSVRGECEFLKIISTVVTYLVRTIFI